MNSVCKRHLNKAMALHTEDINDREAFADFVKNQLRRLAMAHRDGRLFWANLTELRKAAGLLEDAEMEQVTDQPQTH